MVKEIEPVKVLIAEDDAVSRRVVEKLIAKWGYEALPAKDGLEAWAVLEREDRPPLAILDWMMPGLSGPDLCRRVRQQTDRPYLYILLLTARTQESDLIEGLESGADDYLTKPVRAQELRARLYAGQRILDVQQQLIEAREELRVLSVRDALTGLYNRRYLEASLERELHRAERSQVPLAVIMLDIDHFKRFNDTEGHAAGDALLKGLGDLLQASVRRDDIACRYGGEEFVMILPGMPVELAKGRAEELRQAMHQADFQHEGRNLGTVTVSLGVAVFPEHGIAIGPLLQAADKALYLAKSQGRDCVVVSPPAAEVQAPVDGGSTAAP
jgi:diguanylate cyclase (GGDEF)-like protein